MIIYIFLRFEDAGLVKSFVTELEDLTAVTKTLLNNGGIIESLEYEELDDSMSVTVKYDN